MMLSSMLGNDITEIRPSGRGGGTGGGGIGTVTPTFSSTLKVPLFMTKKCPFSKLKKCHLYTKKKPFRVLKSPVDNLCLKKGHF